MQYELINASTKDIPRIIEYKLKTILSSNNSIDSIEEQKVINYVMESVPKQILQYQNILVKKKIIGCLLVTPFQDGMLIDELYVEKEYRHQRIATNIINKICAQNNKVYLWVYKSNLLAIKLYEKLGFQTIQATATRFFMSHVSKTVK